MPFEIAKAKMRNENFLLKSLETEMDEFARLCFWSGPKTFCCFWPSHPEHALR